MPSPRSKSAALSLLLLFTPVIAVAQSAEQKASLADGQARYQQLCAECHEGALLEAPQRAAFEFYTPRRIVEVLEFGSMATSGMALTRQQKRNVAYYLTGEQFDESKVDIVSFSCEATLPEGARLTQPVAWNGWGGESGNARFQASETILTKDNVDQLALKWFARCRSCPALQK